MHLNLLRYTLAFCISSTFALPSVPAKTHDHVLLPRAYARDVFVVQELQPWGLIRGKKGEGHFPSHSYLIVDESEVDGRLKIEIMGNEQQGGALRDGVVRYFDLTTDAKAGPFAKASIEGQQIVTKVGQVRLRNQAFLDEETGKGIVMDVLNQDPEYRRGKSNVEAKRVNVCHTYIQRLIANPDVQKAKAGKLEVDNNLKTQLERFNKWSSEAEPKGVKSPIKAVETAWGKAGGGKDESRSKTYPSGCGGKKSKRAGSCQASKTAPGGKRVNELALEPDTAKKLEKFGTLEVDTTDVVADQKAGKIDTSKAKTSLVKAGGKFSAYTVVAKEALAGAGIAATIAGAVFVILDFVDGDWKMGTIGAVGLAVGIAAGLAIAGPVGWIIGGAIALFFALLPGALEGDKWADRTDVTGIIQQKMFGDKDHNPSKQCQDGTKDVPGNKDCQALFGSGTLTQSLKMNNFDTIAFMIQFNDGYAMSIKDLAAAFYVVDKNKPNDGADKIATIECDNHKGTPAGRAGIIGGDSSKVCARPSFHIKREKIQLPGVNDNADNVYNKRMVPAPGGDCKLIAYPGEQFFPDDGITLSGLPSAIACGLDADSTPAGTVVSDPKQSTDQQGGAHVAASTKPNGFAPLPDDKYLCLITKQNNKACFPQGQYHPQHNNGLHLKDVEQLTLPGSGGWSLKVHTKGKTMFTGRGPAIPGRPSDKTFDKNVDNKKQDDYYKDFTKAMDAMEANEEGEAIMTVVGPNDGPNPVCCLFTDTQFGGQVYCAGKGGADLPEEFKKQISSISCHGGAKAYLYGDAGYDTEPSALIEGNVEDLKEKPYDKDKGTFDDRTIAMWVFTDSDIKKKR